MGLLNKLCAYCDNKQGLLSTGYICKLSGKELDQKSDLFKYGCDGGASGYKYCSSYQAKK